MYNSSSDHNGGGGGGGVPMSPRISFSNDFVESHHYQQQQQRLQPPTTGYSRPSTGEPTTDFEFSVSNHYSLQLMTADELFSQGRMLPLMNNRIRNPTGTTTTLRDELLVEEEDEEVEDSVNNNNNNVGKRRPPLAGGWRSFLGIRKSHIGSRKPPVSPVAAATASEPQTRFDEPVTKGHFFHGVDPNQNPNLFSSSSTQQGMLTDDSTEDMKF